MNVKILRLQERNQFYAGFFVLTAILFLARTSAAQGEDDDYISPVRPTVSDSATIQRKGILQIETGGDFDFRAPDYSDQQSAPLGIYFAANKRLRLDLEFDAFISQKDEIEIRESSMGDVSLGFKAIARDKPDERLAVAYSVKLPTADEEKGLGTGKIDHNLRLILNRNYDKNDFIVNFAYLNVGRKSEDRRNSGAQVVFTYERELPKKFGLVVETFGNTVDERQPRGIYLLGALTYKINKRLVFDVGARPGFGRDAPKIGIFVGLTVGVANLYGKK